MTKKKYPYNRPDEFRPKEDLAESLKDYPLIYIPVELSHCRYLYHLLETRPPEANISHKSMPSYEEHVCFVASKPYPIWYIINTMIRGSQTNIGQVYVTDRREIGIQLEQPYCGVGAGKRALEHIQQCARRLAHSDKAECYANVAPLNMRSRRFFESDGWEICQITYRKLVEMDPVEHVCSLC